MPLKFEVPSTLDHFACLVGHDVAFPLLEAAASLAVDAMPELDVQDVLLQLDGLLARLRKSIPSGATPMQRCYTLNEFFYEKLGFAANANDFSDPANSYMHHVLHTRRGIPISLAVLWMELAQGIGLRADGISFPGHFLVKVYVDEGIIIQDPLTGRGLTQNMLSERLEPFREGWGLAEEEIAPLHLFLMPASGREIIERMLRNLRSVYEQEQQLSLLLGVLHRLVILRPDFAEAYRDRGLVLAQMGQRDAALQDLQTYVRTAQAPQDLPVIEAHIELLRAEG
ncbi:MAG TPA: tetratricopeptide repeat protein [Comamonas sp.]|uniref:SirB1 family protein n=1 Tax=Comamonas halotolerans TaxID=3041496 RepID=UPI0024E0CD21|nr:tetratricopeptide repeat protein [Comamonas sp. NoAH]